MDALRQRGLNGFQLKMIGLILMLFDHIHEFFSFTGRIPLLFKWLGRIVAPIFMFLVVEGYTHTRNKKKYMLKLYIGSVLMNFGNYIFLKYLPRADGFTIENNIFGTLFMIVIYMVIIDFLKRSIKRKDIIKIILSILFLIIPFVVGSSIISIVNVTNFDFLNYIIPNIYLVEGGPVFVILGLVFYVTKDNIHQLVQSYAIFCLALLFGSFAESNFNIRGLFYGNYQWMMIFSAIFFYLYNGEKGKGLKYLFYIFYPVHIYLLYTISCFIIK